MASNRRKLKVQPSPIIPPRLRQKIASIASLNNIYPVNLKSPTSRVKTSETYFQQTNVARRSFPANRPLTSRSKSEGQASFDPTEPAETAGLHFKASGCLMIGALAGTPAGKPPPSSPSTYNDLRQSKSQRDIGIPSRPSTAPNPNSHNEDSDGTVEYSIAGRVLPIKEAVFEMPRSTAGSAVGKFQQGNGYLVESTRSTTAASSNSLSPSDYGLLASVQGKALSVNNSDQQVDILLNFDDPSQCERVNLNRKSLYKCPILQNEDFIRLLNYQNNHISRIEHLELLGNLVFLDMYNNHIEKISGLDTLFSLRVLMLGRNRIKKIENLNSLHKLDVLDLHRNEISVIENISHLRELRVLNLEDNRILEASSFAGLDSLAEFNLSRNQIHAVRDIHRLSNLRRFLLSDNTVSNSDDISDILRLPNIVEFSLENNPLSQESFYRPLFVFRMRTLKVLDSRRVLEEERRNAGKVARKEAEKRKENERVVAQQEERKRVIEFIKRSWEDGTKSDRRIDAPGSNIDSGRSLRARDLSIPNCRPQTAPPTRPGSSSSRNRKGPLCFDDAQKMNDNQNSYTELSNGILYIYGQGLTMIDKLETAQVSTIHLNYINVTSLASFFPKLRRFPNLKSLHMSNNSFSELKQVHHLCGLRSLEILDISQENNPAVDLPSFRDYAIFRLGHLPLKSLCGVPVALKDVEQAMTRYDGLYRVTLSIPRSILAKTSDHVLPVNVFDDDDKIRASTPNATISQNEYFTRTLESGYNIESRRNGRYHSFSKTYTENLIGEAITTTNKLHVLSALWPNAMENACRDTLQQYCQLGPEEYLANILRMVEGTPDEMTE